MGRIVEGRISGKLPDRIAFAVNYPGYPSSEASAIKTLGGEEGLAKARTSESNFLELKFRPDDPFAHPAFGELRHSSDLVLRLSKPARHSSGSQATSMSANSNLDIVEIDESGQSRRANEEAGGQGQEIEAEIIAKVDHTYAFDGMADYQYVIAVHASAGASNNHKRKGMEENSVKEKGALLDMDASEMMMLVPPLFSVKDIPEEIFLRTPAGKKKKQLVVACAEAEDMQGPCFALDFKIKDVPKKGNWELKLLRGSEPWLRTAALVRLFQERPIWTRNMLNERLIEQGIILTDHYLRSLLFRIAYYFGCGPFRNLWIRNGYDPRLDSESRAYQMIDFRVPIVLRGEAEASSPPPRKWSFSDMCAFKAVPQKKFTHFQLIDLQDDDIQAQIESPPERTVCSQFTGWFRLSTIKRLRQIMRLRFLALFPGEVARALESVERKSWERSKFVTETEQEERLGDEDRTDLNIHFALEAGQMDSYRMGEEDTVKTAMPLFSGPEQLNGVDLNATDEEEEDEEEDEEDIEEDVDQLDEGGLKTNVEEDEEEEEELEDDTEELQSQQGIAEAEEPSIMNDYMDPADNIPKNYLQALLGKFAFNSNGDERSGAVGFDEDGQYTIYEQDEDEDEDEED